MKTSIPRGAKPANGNSAREPAWQGSTRGEGRRRHLTKRELEVLALLCEGLSNKQIGRRLDIAAQTVKVHVGNILRSLGVSTRLQAVLIARCWELGGDPGADPGNREAGPHDDRVH